MTDDSPIRIAVIGAGVVGFYAVGYSERIVLRFLVSLVIAASWRE